MDFELQDFEDDVKTLEEKKKALESELSTLPAEFDDIINNFDIPKNTRKFQEARKIELELNIGFVVSKLEILKRKKSKFQKEHPFMTFDLLNDLTLSRIFYYLHSKYDVKALFSILRTQEQILDACYQQLRWIWEIKEGCNPNLLFACDSKEAFPLAYLRKKEDEFCSNSVFCMRCFLYSVDKCLKCNTKSVKIPFKKTGPIFGCKSHRKDMYGIHSICSNMLECIFCHRLYTNLKVYQSGALQVDFASMLECSCLDNRKDLTFKRSYGIVCRKCIQVCHHCGNIGCIESFHFKVNTKALKDFDRIIDENDKWPICEECNKQHCCARYNFEENEWDYCVCPIYEEYKPIQIKRTRVPKKEEKEKEEGKITI